MTKLRLLIPVSIASALLLSGCASERYKAEMRRQKLEKDKYVDYYPVGSNLPIKVPKDEAKASTDETERAQEVFRDVQKAGVITPGEPRVPAVTRSEGGR